MALVMTPVVSFNGTNLTPAWLAALLEVRVEREMQVPGRVTLRFIDPGYVLLQTNLLELGVAVEVTDPSGSPVLIAAEVTSVAVEQREREQPELVVVAHDKSHRLGRATNLKSYLSMSYSDVVTTLAGSAGLSAQVTSTNVTMDYFMQVDSDLGLITELARRVGFDWWVDGTTLYFAPPTAGTQVSLVLGAGLRSLSVRASGHHPDSVTVDGWDRAQQEMVTATVSSPTSGVTASSNLADLVSTPSTAFGSATLLTVGLSAQSQAEAAQLGQAIYDRGRAGSVTARGLADGNGALSLGCAVSVTDAGPLSGSYPVTRVEHLYRPTSGYTTRFVAGDRRPTSLVDTLAGTAANAMPTHRHPGVAVGQVTNINDPNNAGRVKVRYPGASAADETGWARVVAIGGGKNRGSVFIPEVNDEVLVAFEGGDPRQPVVIGGLYGAQSTIPTTTIAEGTVQSRAMTSRLGHVVSLLDGTAPASQAIELMLAGGEHKVHLGKDNLAITVPQGLPISITAGQSSIKFGQDGAITIAAPSITLQATQQVQLSGAQISVSADATLSLQGQASTAIKGAQVQMQGEGPVIIAGQPVMIN
jgi:phage protein D